MRHLAILLFLSSGIALPLTQATANTLADQGKAVFNSFCIYCHGADGSGNGPAGGLSGVRTGDLSNKAYMRLLSDQELSDRITYGEEKFPYLQMPGWRSNLDDATIKALVAYVRTLAVDKGPLKGPTPQQRQQLFSQDPLVRGRTYYLRYCSACHGKSGNGKGDMANKLIGKPVDFTSREVAATLNLERVQRYVENLDRADYRSMPVFDPSFHRYLKDIVSYIKTLSK